MPHVRICAGGAGQPASLPRPDGSRPKDYERAVVVDTEVNRKGRPLFGVNGVVCPKKERENKNYKKKFLTRAGIVRDVRFHLCQLNRSMQHHPMC